MREVCDGFPGARERFGDPQHDVRLDVEWDLDHAIIDCDRHPSEHGGRNIVGVPFEFGRLEEQPASAFLECLSLLDGSGEEAGYSCGSRKSEAPGRWDRRRDFQATDAAVLSEHTNREMIWAADVLRRRTPVPCNDRWPSRARRSPGRDLPTRRARGCA